ncbi:MAG: dihydroxy-acid dehydratase [Pelagimonas sp.]|jgi:hypothetical protein|nr:dihydroxy-acid dehydratase [Pelagimonas sp.]
MRMWRWPVLIACGAMLAGCLAPVPDSAPDGQTRASETNKRGGNAPFLSGLFGPRAPTEKTLGDTRPKLPKPLASADLAGGKVVVRGPRGYCIDPTTVQRGPMRGFALLASCSILSGGKAGLFVDPLLITVTTGPRGSAQDLPSAMEIASGTGAELLKRVETDQLTRVQLRGDTASVLPNGDDRYWRSTFALNGRLVALALYAPEGSAYAGTRGGDLLNRTRRQIIAASSKD